MGRVLGGAIRWIAITLTVNSLFFAAGVTAGLPIYVWPKIDPLQHADAVFVLGNSAYFIDPDEVQRRNSLGLEIVEQGWAPVVAISDGASDNRFWTDKPCSKPDPKLFHCFRADPRSTLGEGRMLRNLAKQFGWKKVIVITFRPHISRARYILGNCFDGELLMVASPAEMPVRRWAFEYAYQTAGFIKAFFEQDC